MKAKMNSRFTRALVMITVICLTVCMLSTAVLAANDAVTACAKGVVQINLIYTNDDNQERCVSSGTAFLINDTTLLTCYHVVTLDSDDLAELAADYGKSVAEIQNRLSITVTVSRDLTIPATYVNGSAEVDYAIVKMSQSLPTKTPLTLRHSSEVSQTENVWTVGFPVMDTLLQSYSTYTEDDVNIANGSVTKIAMGINMYSGANTEYIQTNCNMDLGNSGGPMVDENGYVVGISQGVWTWADSDVSTAEYYNAIAIDEIINTLDMLGIVYNVSTGSGSDEVVTTEPAETQAPTQAATEAPTTAATLPPMTQDDNTGSESNGTGMILVIAAIAVVVIIVVVIVILMSGNKKKAAPAPAAVPVGAAPRPIPPTPPAPSGFSAPPTYPVQDAGETSVLGGGAGETTVLSRNAVNGGTLTRKRTGETITINADQFVIGRERKSTNYCISDNSSVSRTHARLSVRGGVTYLTDMNTANGTFVNGVKVMPRQEIALKSGDKITLADEDLEYKN